MKARILMAVTTIAALISAPFSFAADDDIGIFETLHASSVSFEATTAAVDAAFAASDLVLHATHDVRVPDEKHRARVYVLTSPEYVSAASAESVRTVSAQVLRVAVYTQGDEQKTFINMANPVAHAMVFYADSPNYDALVAAARNAAAEIRALVARVPGAALAEQQEPRRSQKHYNAFKGDGPARMMAKFRTFKKSQLPIIEDKADNFDAVIDKVAAALATRAIAGADESEGWEQLALIRLSDDAAYIGVTNPYIEDKMIRINSRFRKGGKSELSPYPGVDHVAALPAEILVVREGSKTLVLHYGQMWRMQLYFWDSGYRAFTANVGVPGEIAGSIEETVSAR
ncbi:MAG: hypothetical protein OEY37_01315 [Gammaproteobacteria bacterium]|nr:hypothetical protein [Gammaproteobacteria bacterium]MDH5617145.1 hypothetical protein [Gammaproteobacteria bacterium]